MATLLDTKEPYQPTGQIQMRDLLDKVRTDTIRAINCCLPGKIVSFSAAKNTASVELQINRVMANGEEIEIKQLVDCPVVTLFGGTSSLTMPITAGDGCLVFFADRDIDSWWLSGSKGPPNTPRCHSLSDGFVLVGVRPMLSPVTYAMNPTLNGGAAAITIKNDMQSLKSLIDNLITAIKAITVTCASPGSQSGVPLNAASFDLLKTQFGLLLKD